jgi:CDP-glycerol glycerophosphotransferase
MKKILNIFRNFNKHKIFEKDISLINLKLTSISTKKKNIFLIYGYGHQEYFSGITKSLMINLKKETVNFDFYFLTLNKKLHDLMIFNNLPSILWSENNFNKKDMDILLHAKFIFTEYEFSEVETCEILYALLEGAKKIQGWHGRFLGHFKIIPNKLDKNFIKKDRTFYRYIHRKSFEILMSPLIDDEIFHLKELDFEFKKIIKLGDPKIDLIKTNHSNDELINVDLDIYNKAKSSKSKKVLILPGSSRAIHGRKNLKQLKQIDLKLISKNLKSKNIEVYIKRHMIDGCKDQNLENIFFIKDSSDIFPLLSYFDIFITDYSSLIIQLLFLKRPIITFLDIDDFLMNDKSIISKDYISIFKETINATSIKELIKLITCDDLEYKYQNQIKNLNKFNEKYNSLSLEQMSSNQYISEIKKLFT